MDKFTAMMVIDDLINKLTSLKMDVSNDVHMVDSYTDPYTKLLFLLAKLLKEPTTKYDVDIRLLRDYIMEHNNSLIKYQLKSFSLTDKNIDTSVYMEMCAIASSLK